MAYTQQTLADLNSRFESNPEYQKGLGYFSTTVVFSAGTTTGTFTPDNNCGIKRIDQIIIAQIAGTGTTMVAVPSYDATTDKDLLGLTVAGNSTWLITVIGKSAPSAP